MLCDQMSSGLNLYLHNNDIYLLMNVVPFKVDLLGLYIASPVIMLLFDVFCKVHCLKLSKCALQFCLNYGDILVSWSSHLL
jgi:hypothetical protein